MSSLPKQKNEEDLYYYISRKVGDAIGDYGMISDGDRILVAVSGGKDSMTLLEMLRYRQRFAPVKYELLALYVDMGVPGFPVDQMKKHFKNIGVPLIVEPADILQGGDWSDVNCYYCSQLRRKTLFQLADKNGCRKIALGHHLDDIVETILMNMCYRGEIGAMCPNQEMFEGAITIIRPLAYVHEKDIIRLLEQGKTMRFEGQCPNDRASKRTFFKGIVSQLEADDHAVKKNILKSLRNIKHEYLP
ncbi:MAG TPA: ATP-binding protein [Candidatus Omnitrophota bacterium]|nr:ATP-binding protein [Candidatus Omnitrophota bacterium]